MSVVEVFGVIDWSKSKQLPVLVETMNQDNVLSEHSFQIALDKPEICLGTISKTDEKNSHWHYDSRDIILHGSVGQKLNLDFGWENADLSQIGDRIFDGIYNLIIWCDRTKSLLVTSDYLSIKTLYYWQQDEIIVISSNLKTFRHLPFIPQKLNPQVLADTIALAHPFNDDTLIAGVKTLPVNCYTVFQAEKIEFVTRSTADGEIDSISTEAELIDRLNGLMEKSLTRWLGDISHVSIGLSGGLDSRILLGYLQRLRTKITAATWGEPGSDDFELGVALAKATNTEYFTYAFTGNTTIAASDLKFPAWQIESLGDPNVLFYWRGWNELLQTQNHPLIHGFLGDSLGGGRIGKWGVSPQNFAGKADEAAIVELKAWGENVAPDFLREFATPEFKPYLTQGIAENLIDAFNRTNKPYVYQRLMLLDFYYRQRRHIGNAFFKITEMFLPTISPFYTKENIDFALQLPLELVSNRKIFRKLLLEQFPALSNFQEADKGKLPIYSDSIQKQIDRLISNRYMWRLFPKLKPRDSRLVFDLLVQKHALVFLETIERSGKVLNDYLNVEQISDKLKKGDISSRDRRQITRLFNVCVFINRYFN